MEWDGGSRVQTYLSILCFDAQFSRKGSAGFRFAASQVVYSQTLQTCAMPIKPDPPGTTTPDASYGQSYGSPMHVVFGICWCGQIPQRVTGCGFGAGHGWYLVMSGTVWFWCGFSFSRAVETS